ncbi:hypothetical protein [Flavobacterium sp.]|uniref:hypothetical protein n=1 Tax=Flavobacterium sp. TaxID=239 RepID=UPI00286E9A85|nr:hypothetical protein [Flavobacterium sp.]
MKNYFLCVVFILTTVSCKNTTTNFEPAITENSPATSKNELFNDKTDENLTLEIETEPQIPELPQSLSKFSMDEVKDIYFYLWVERWNNGGKLGTTGPYYSQVAEQLNIPVSILKEIDLYYSESVEPILKEHTNKLFENYPNFKTDYYDSFGPSAYCGLNTLMGGIVIYGQKNKTNFTKEGLKIAEKLVLNLPEWYTGCKINTVAYKDTILETEGDINIGFLWQRGHKIKIMDSRTGTYGFEDPEQNYNWHTPGWNNQKRIDYPKRHQLHNGK